MYVLLEVLGCAVGLGLCNLDGCVIQTGFLKDLVISQSGFPQQTVARIWIVEATVKQDLAC